MLPTKRSAIALARGARTGVLMVLTSMAVKTASKAAVNLLSRSRIRNAKRRWASSRSHEQVAGLLGQPGSGRVRGHVEDVDAAGGEFDDEERVEAVQGDRVEVEQVAGQDAVGLGVEELRPGGTGSPWRGIDARGVEDGPHGGGADRVAESGEFAVHAAISPGGILGRQAHDQRADTGGDGRSACPDGLAGPSPADEVPVPAQDGGRGDQQSAAATSK